MQVYFNKVGGVEGHVESLANLVPEQGFLGATGNVCVHGRGSELSLLRRYVFVGATNTSIYP